MKRALILAIALLLSGCGGTFTLDSTGTLSYTTPKLIVPHPSK